MNIKKTLMFSAFATLLLTSCTKNYSCKCVTVYHPSLGIGTTTQTINLKAKKRDAKATCEGTSVNAPGSYAQTCTLL